jgi:hypothetical protein
VADPLAEFRRAGNTPKAAQGPEQGLIPYKAFAVAPRGSTPRLDIRWRELGHALSYSTLLDIVYDPSDYTGFFLAFSINLEVKVDGRGLHPVVDALKANSCEFLEEYDAKRFAPPEADSAVIERISLRAARAEAEKR